MDHSFPAPDAVRPWRTATLIASAFAALELVILLVIAVIALGRPLAHHAATAAATRGAASSVPAHTIVAPAAAKPKLARADLEVEILNGNGRQEPPPRRRARSVGSATSSATSGTPPGPTTCAASSCTARASAPRACASARPRDQDGRPPRRPPRERPHGRAPGRRHRQLNFFPSAFRRARSSGLHGCPSGPNGSSVYERFRSR